MSDSLITLAARELAGAEYAIALTGAGISTESGIRDFRGPSGVWTLNPEAERRAYQGYREFMADPRGWWEHLIAGGHDHSLGDLSGAQPNAGHRALVELEKMGVIRTVITQNIDALHEKAGSQHLLEYHGSSAKLRCVSCGARFRRDEFDFDMLLATDSLPPVCPRCNGVIKSDTVFFGETIPADVAGQSLEEAARCDLMLVCGTSAVVFPFAGLPRVAKETNRAVIIEINAEPTPLTESGITDYFVQGKTGEVLPELVLEVKRLIAGEER